MCMLFRQLVKSTGSFLTPVQALMKSTAEMKGVGKKGGKKEER